MKSFRNRWVQCLLLLTALVLASAVLVAYLNVRGEDALPTRTASEAITPQLIERGAYIARAGNCAACHTARGGAEFAGGTGIDTPFGTVFAPNITPDEATGIGSWSPDHFWRAMHHGRSKDGRLLYPAFPYPNYTQVTREDSDALYAYLRSVPKVSQANKPHALGFPYNLQASLAVWRALYFQPGVYEPQSDKTAEWNRGAYLVRGLGHCIACHSTRNALGATSDGVELAGGLIPVQNWYAPSLASSAEAGVAGWETRHVVSLLKTGVAPGSTVMGPMAEVVYRSTQHLSDGDLQAMAVFLKSLPQEPSVVVKQKAPDPTVMARGAELYDKNCAACHGAQGQGAAGAYPQLAGNRAVTMHSPANLVRVVLNGGYAPATAGNPRPYGMPPFGPTLADPEMAAVLTYIRNAWGNQAPPLSELDVLRLR
jgi:mono/diheme cytochrome c family protein